MLFRSMSSLPTLQAEDSTSAGSSKLPGVIQTVIEEEPTELVFIGSKLYQSNTSIAQSYEHNITVACLCVLSMT